MEDFSDDLKRALTVLRNGGTILYPTDTIWGIGCDATNPTAVRKVYDIKRRVDSKTMLSLVDSSERLLLYVEDIPEIADSLIEASDTPLTLILDGASRLAPSMVAADGSAGFRVTREAFSRELCRRFGKPIVSTSANVSGEPSPSCFHQISEEIKGAVDYVVGYRQNDVSESKPSGIIQLHNDGTFKIIRH